MTILLKSAPMVEEKKAKMEAFLAEASGILELLIIRDNDDPVIEKYVKMKQRFGEKLGVMVEDFLARDLREVSQRVEVANEDPAVTGMIVQLPLRGAVGGSGGSGGSSDSGDSGGGVGGASATEEICRKIAPEKDVDGLNDAASEAIFLPATAKAILDLVEFYGFDFRERKVAVVGRGKLVGRPVLRELTRRGVSATVFHRGSELAQLRDFDLIITATGVPELIKSEDVAPGTILVDAGTASEKGILKGDLAPELYERKDLEAITPRIGGVGPATVACLFENLVLQ